MYTDCNNFFTVRTRNLWHRKRILRLPPHLYSVTALPSKTYSTTNIDAHVWLIDVNGPSATTKVTVMRLIKKYSSEVAVFNMFLYFTRVYMTARSIILTAYTGWSWIIETLSAVLRDLGRPLPASWPAVVNFFSQTIHTCHRPSLDRKFFLLGVWPHFFTVRRPFIKQQSSFVILPI